MSASMAGQKLTDLISAAKDLVNIVVATQQTPYYSKVAIVPYSMAVNVGTYATQARGSYSSGTSTTPGKQYFKFTNPSGQSQTFQISTCVSERTGTNAYTDAAPTTTLLGRNYPAPSNPCLSNTIVPLSSDKAALTTAIGALQASGSTGGHIGVAWGWYLLSPNFGYMFPTTSQPASYSNLTTLNANGKPILQKIAILMTDGEYNSAYCKGVISQDSTTGSGNTADHINCNAPNGSSWSQAKTLCTNMKQKGITIYTIGFQVDSAPQAQDMLTSCATDTTKLYLAADGDQLKQAFHDIAIKLTSLYLSQ
jgi:hypothetical protein